MIPSHSAVGAAAVYLLNFDSTSQQYFRLSNSTALSSLKWLREAPLAKGIVRRGTVFPRTPQTKDKRKKGRVDVKTDELQFQTSLSNTDQKRRSYRRQIGYRQSRGRRRKESSYSSRLSKCTPHRIAATKKQVADSTWKQLTGRGHKGRMDFAATIEQRHALPLKRRKRRDKARRRRKNKGSDSRPAQKEPFVSVR